MIEITMNQVKSILEEINPTFIDESIATINIDNNGQVTVLNEEDGNLVYTLANYKVITKISVRVELIDEDGQESFKTFRAIASDNQLEEKLRKHINKIYDDTNIELEALEYAVKLNNQLIPYDMGMWTM